MSFQPLHYPNLQCLLQYLEANKRLQLSQRCPSIRAAERSVPLRIKHLTFRRNFIHLNEKVYQIGIYQKYHIGKTPKEVQEENVKGGAEWEMDKFGIKYYTDAPLTPGDIDVFGRGGHQEVFRTNDEKIGALEHRIQVYEGALAVRRAGGVDQNFEGMTEKDFEEILESWHSELLRHQHLRDHAPTPCEQLVQLTIETKNPAERRYEVDHIERYFYHNRSWTGTMKQLATIIFGGRRRPIYVGNIYFEQYQYPLRLPVDIKFRAQRMYVTGPLTNVFEGLNPIIHESNYPMDHLDINPVALVAHQVVTTAKVLTVSHFYQGDPILPALLSLTNGKVHFKYSSHFIFNETLIALVESWIANKRQVGTLWEFSFCRKEPVVERMTAMATRFNRAAIGRRFLNIPMDNASQLEISYSEGFDSLYEEPNWTIKMAVIPAIKIDSMLSILKAVFLNEAFKILYDSLAPI